MTLKSWLPVLSCALLVACAPATPAPSAGAGRTEPPPASSGAVASAPAAPPAPIPLRAAYTSVAGAFGPIYLAQDLGLFAEQGLATTLVQMDSTQAAQALVAGDLDLVVAGAQSAIEPALAGADTVLLGSFTWTLEQALVTPPHITRPEQLRGAKIGVAGPRGAVAIGVRLQVKALGLDPQRDITLVPLGNPSNNLAAMASGVIDGAGLSPPATAHARRAGYYFWEDVPGVASVDFVSTGPISRRSIVASHRDTLLRALRALAKATAIQKYDRERSFPVLAKYFQSDDPEALEETFRVFHARLTPDLRPNPRGLQTVLEYAEHPAAREARVEQFLDLSLLDDLEREGFFATLPQG
jgi:NitT/TauT family transport system substrate-binding protein